MNEQIMQADNVFDLFALFSSYILEHFDKNPYEFYDFEDDNYNDVHDAVEKYVSDVGYKGHKCAVRSLKKTFIQLFNNEFNIEKCYAVVRYIDDLIECKKWKACLNTKISLSMIR